MNKLCYTAHLRSAEWYRIRIRRLALDGHRCRTCGHDGSLFPLQVHHVTYDRLGAEAMGDLITLCSSCHQAISDAAQRRRRALANAGGFESLGVNHESTIS